MKLFWSHANTIVQVAIRGNRYIPVVFPALDKWVFTYTSMHLIYLPWITILYVAVQKLMKEFVNDIKRNRLFSLTWALSLCSMSLINVSHYFCGRKLSLQLMVHINLVGLCNYREDHMFIIIYNFTWLTIRRT